MRYGIYGYGRLARAVEAQIRAEGKDVISAVFTRRPPNTVPSPSRICSAEKAEEFKGEIDCMLVCRGSANDLPRDTPYLAEHFTVVDSYDKHSDLSRHLASCARSTEKSREVAIIGAGWDPGLLSVVRTLLSAVFPKDNIVTFWGEGVSQGHSEAIRRVDGVIDAVQYTVPTAEALKNASAGVLSVAGKKNHKRICYIAAEQGREHEIAERVITMPEYFSPYETELNFVTLKELREKHGSLHHRGRIIARGAPHAGSKYPITFDLDLSCGSNPELTAALMLASARAALKIKAEGRCGAFTLADIPPRYLTGIDYFSLM